MFGRMFVRITTLLEMTAKIERLGAESRARDAEIIRLTNENRTLQTTISSRDLQIAMWRDEELALHKAATAARTMCDLLRVEVNALREKEAALTAQLLPTYRVAVPRVETDDGLLAGVGMFDDMGERNAKRDSVSDFIPVPPGDVHGSPRTPEDVTPKV